MLQAMPFYATARDMPQKPTGVAFVEENEFNFYYQKVFYQSIAKRQINRRDGRTDGLLDGNTELL